MLWITVGKSGDKWCPWWISGSITSVRSLPFRRPEGFTVSMFLGRYAHALDAKGRLAIPARFREALADGVVLTRGIDRCVALYPISEWQPLAEKVRALPITDPDARNFRRMVFAEATDLTLDGQGRILVPPELRRYAGLERETLVVGVDTAIEIWSPERWQAVQAVMDADGAAIAQRLATLI